VILTNLNMADSKQYEVGHLVWAKIRGYPMWPAKVCQLELLKR
jgi:hypothetical protein